MLEFFSYACPHCSAFEPTIEAWEKQLPADVVFRRVPVAFLMNAENFMRTYYALESLGVVEPMQIRSFAPSTSSGKRLEKPARTSPRFVAKNGGDSAKFLAAFKSFSVATSVDQGQEADGRLQDRERAGADRPGPLLTSPSQAGAGSRVRGRRPADPVRTHGQ